MASLHIVRKPIKNCGTNRYYVYAWRGGPCIHMQDHIKPAVTPSLLAKQLAVIKATRAAEEIQEEGESLASVILAYKASPEFKKLADRTREGYELWLDRIESQFGKAIITAFDSRKILSEIMSWRDQWGEQPRAADTAISTFSLLLSWAAKRGMLDGNILLGKVDRLHKVNRADLVWEERHWQSLRDAKVPHHIMKVVEFGALTGFRLSDLIEVEWKNVNDIMIMILTNKSRKTQSATIPLYKDLIAWLDAQKPENGEEPTGIILRNSRGYPWTMHGFKTSLNKKTPDGFDRHFHDLRGTFATNLIMAGFTNQEAADTLGWKTKRVEDIRRRYVDNRTVVISLAEKLAQHRAR